MSASAPWILGSGYGLHTIVDDDAGRTAWLRQGAPVAVGLGWNVLFEPGFLDGIKGRGRKVVEGFAALGQILNRRGRHRNWLRRMEMRKSTREVVEFKKRRLLAA